VEQRGQVYLTESVYKVVLQQSIPAQIHQLVLYISNGRDWGRCRPHFGIFVSQKVFFDPNDSDRANIAHIRQSRPDFGIGFQVRALKTV
jgi:hypothetical protein